MVEVSGEISSMGPVCSSKGLSPGAGPEVEAPQDGSDLGVGGEGPRVLETLGD